MYPSLFPFLTQQAPIIPGSTAGMDHYGGLRRQDAALAENHAQFGQTEERARDKQDFDKRRIGSVELEKYGQLIALGTKEGRDLARAMRPQLEMLGVYAPAIPDEQGWAAQAAPGVTAPGVPAVPGAAPGASAGPPDEFHDKGIQKDIAALPDIAGPDDETPAPLAPVGSGTVPKNFAPVAKGISKVGAMGDLPSSDERIESEDRILSIGGQNRPVTLDRNMPDPGAAPTQGELTKAPVAAAPTAPVGAPALAPSGPVAPPLMRGGLPVMSSEPDPIEYRDKFSGDRTLHGIDSAGPNKRNRAETATDAEAFGANFPTEYKGYAQGAVAGASSPDDVAKKGKEARGTIEQMMRTKAAVEGAKLRGATAERRLAIAEGTQESTQFYKGVDLAERGMKRPVPTKALEAYEGLEGADELLANGNSVDQSLIYRELAMSVNKGAFSDKDAVSPDQFQSWSRKVQNYIDTGAMGTLSAEEIADLRATIANKRAKAYSVLKNTYDAEMDSAARGGLPNDPEARRGWAKGMNELHGGFGYYNQDAVDQRAAGGARGGSTHKSVSVSEKTAGPSSSSTTVVPAGSLEKRKEALP